MALGSPSFQKYFLALILPVLSRPERLLDVGCGTGMYFPLIAPLCGSLTGIELSSGTARLARQAARDYDLSNVSITLQDSSALAHPDDCFDAALCVDSLHHIYDLEGTLAEIARVVKPGGDILIFEPNLANPLLLAMCVLDRNEWGAVGRCYKWRYERRFARRFRRVRGRYNGLLIGPQGKLSLAIADFLLREPFSRVLACFSPKLFFHLENR